MRIEEVEVLAGNCKLEFMPVQSADVAKSIVVCLQSIIKNEDHSVDSSLKGELEKTVKRKISELKISDLVIYPGIGVYLFYNHAEKKWWYVGKSTSRSFVERIPSHYDPRASSWMNVLTKRTYELIFLTNERVDDWSDATKYCVENLNLLLINFKCSETIGCDTVRDTIGMVEEKLIELLQPELQRKA